MPSDVVDLELRQAACSEVSPSKPAAVVCTVVCVQLCTHSYVRTDVVYAQMCVRTDVYAQMLCTHRCCICTDVVYAHVHMCVQLCGQLCVELCVQAACSEVSPSKPAAVVISYKCASTKSTVIFIGRRTGHGLMTVCVCVLCVCVLVCVCVVCVCLCVCVCVCLCV